MNDIHQNKNTNLAIFFLFLHELFSKKPSITDYKQHASEFHIHTEL